MPSMQYACPHLADQKTWLGEATDRLKVTGMMSGGNVLLSFLSSQLPSSAPVLCSQLSGFAGFCPTPHHSLSRGSRGRVSVNARGGWGRKLGARDVGKETAVWRGPRASNHLVPQAQQPTGITSFHLPNSPMRSNLLLPFHRCEN